MSCRDNHKKTVKKKTIITLIKLILAAGLLIYIFFKLVDFDQLKESLAKMNWLLFVLAVVLQWIIIFIGTHRLQILLRAQELSLSFWKTLKYNCIGYFFNPFSLGATGGDMVKAFYVSRETHHKKTESITVVFLDRIAGMTAVLLIATCSVLATLYIDDTFRPYLPYFFILIFLGISFIVFIFTKDFWKKYIPFDKIFKYKFIKNPFILKIVDFIFHTLAKIIGALYEYRSHKLVAIIALIESIVLQLIMCCFAWCIGTGLNFGIPVYAYFIVFPVATLFLALPITPAGLGIGDAIIIALFAEFGVDKNHGAAFVVLYRLNTLIMSLPGLVLWLLPGTHVTRKELATETEEVEPAKAGVL